MSEIVIFGAGGRAGRQAVAEALRRGHQVTAVVRDPARYDLADVRVVAGDVADAALVSELAAGHDAVISAAAVYGAGTDPAAFFVRSALALRTVHHATRRSRAFVTVGRRVRNATHGRVRLPGGIPVLLPTHRAGLDVLGATEGLDWLYASPAGDFGHEGSPTGRYRVHERGDAASRVTSADFAIALLDEIDTPRHHREHLAVAAGLP